MLNNLYEMDTEPRKREGFAHIPEGLTVIDADGNKVGMVKHFQPPSSSAFPDLSEFPHKLRRSSMPDELIFRILSAGFICVNAGLLAKDRFVFLYQVDEVEDDAVYLFASADDLIKA
jgi:hypothetical protein